MGNRRETGAERRGDLLCRGDVLGFVGIGQWCDSWNERKWVDVWALLERCCCCCCCWRPSCLCHLRDWCPPLLLQPLRRQQRSVAGYCGQRSCADQRIPERALYWSWSLRGMSEK